MRIFHVADTHIGYSAYNRLDGNGLNQREVDVYSSFSQVVELALRERPELVLHSGDLFDTVRPSNRAISFVVGQLLKLSDAGIPTVIISGNHSTPRLRETGSVFKVFEHIKGLELAYAGSAGFEFGDLKVHALPHCADRELFEKELGSLQPDKDFSLNIAMLHAAISGLSVFRMSEFNELMATTNQLDRGFDYVALGHYHVHCEVMKNIVYAGSTERLGFGEAGQAKGFVELDPEKGAWNFRKLDIRPMFDLPVIDCAGMKAEDVAREVTANLESKAIKDALVRQVLKDMDRRELALLDSARLRKLAAEALHFELRTSTLDAGQKIASEDAAFDSVEREFTAYLAKASIEGVDPKRIEELGLDYLASGGDPE